MAGSKHIFGEGTVLMSRGWCSLRGGASGWEVHFRDLERDTPVGFTELHRAIRQVSPHEYM
jgi:hypothetical protein